MSVTLHFHGASGCVTGACFRIETRNARLLVDCGLFQGPKTLKELNYKSFPFKAKSVDAVLLTHAHIDHSGLIPKLILAGFKGPVYATGPTRDLCGVLLPDAGGIQEHEVEQLNRRMQRRGRAPVEPIYTRADAEASMRRFEAVRLEDWTDVAPGVRARWWNAGHILGSASIEVEIADEDEGPTRLLFSGDLGPGGRDFAVDPEGPSGVDHVIVESTYGGVERPEYDQAARRRLLAEAVAEAHALGGPLIVPAFAVERTQELLVDLLAVMDDGQAPEGPIFLDSPLAIRASKIFLERGEDANGVNPFSSLRGDHRIRTTETVDESRGIERISGWHVIVAGSGMCDAGRIRHHLKRLLWRREATVMLVGYQATGTLGRLLQDGARAVKIQGDDVRVRAAVRTLDVYSGHADGPALAAWVKARGPVAGSVFLTHGEPENLRALRERLVADGFDRKRLVTPEIDQSVVLRRAAAEAIEDEAAVRIAHGAAAALDWHNARARFLLELDEALGALPDDAARRKALDRLRGALTEDGR